MNEIDSVLSELDAVLKDSNTQTIKPPSPPQLVHPVSSKSLNKHSVK
jgi:hypothetical protein